MDPAVAKGKIQFPSNVQFDPNNVSVQHVDVNFIFEHVLSQWPIIKWRTGEQPSDRVIHRPQMKNRFLLSKSKDAHDSIETIRNYYYIDPSHVILVAVPKEFSTDSVIAEKARTLLREKGFTPDDIEAVDLGIPQTIAYHKTEYDAEVATLIGVFELPVTTTTTTTTNECIAVLTQEEENLLCDKAIVSFQLEEKLGSAYTSDSLALFIRKNEADLASLKKVHLDFSCFPVCRMGMNEKNAPKACMIESDEVYNSKFYAISTSVPQGLNELMLGTYLDACVNYLKQQVEVQGNLNAILPGTYIYYDFLSLEYPAETQLFLFMNICKKSSK